nr:hypothetical protein BaRGS_011913 [Batillaria attramentaria]
MGNQLPERCPKAAEKHPGFIPFSDLQLHHLPDRWRHEHVLTDIRDTARRVVLLRVRKRSPDRSGGAGRGGHFGTGFVTFDPRWGTVVHTSKHVVLDPFEASSTDVIFFFDSPHDGSRPVVKSRGSARHFRSVWSMDYSSFTLELPMHELFTWQERRADSRHYLTVGQFVHHGFDELDESSSTAMGSLRPPFTFPYHRALDVSWVRRAVALLYEPVTYWALYLTDFLAMEAILFNCTDNFCYFLTLYGYFCSWDDPWTRGAFVGFLCVQALKFLLFARQGWVNAVVHLLATVHALSMHWVTWLTCVLVPREWQSLWWVAPLWFSVLLLSRYVHISRLVKRFDFFRTYVYSDV